MTARPGAAPRFGTARQHTMKRPPVSLQARALAWLAQREQSRSELQRKLLRVALERNPESGDADDGGPENRESAARAQVEQILDRLQALQLLSDERFIASRVRVRAEGFGTRRIESELAQHGLRLEADTRRALRDSELQRATQLWQRRFGAPASDQAARLKQMRFLAGRGFSTEVVQLVLRQAQHERGADDQGPPTA